MELYEVDTTALEEVPLLSTKFFTSKKKDIYGFDEAGLQVGLEVSGLWMVD